MQSETIEHWKDENPRRFSKSDKSSVTLLTSGLPRHILFLFKSIVGLSGLKFEIMDEPDLHSLQFGREFGNRGQCNPTYFTVGNLIKNLVRLRDEVGLSKEEIIRKYAFVTAGGCGPCRMGMYATEYRKALVDSGFEGFRVLILSRSGDVEDVLMDGLSLGRPEILRIFFGLMIGDVLNSINLSRRPFEESPGHVDKVVSEAREMVSKGFEEGKLIKSLFRARKHLKTMNAKVDQSRSVVHIMGEFWAKTTESDGNYNLFKFIESEGGVVSTESITDWLLHQVWRARWMDSRKNKKFFPTKTMIGLKLLDYIMKFTYKVLNIILGGTSHLSNHAALAKITEEHFDLHIDGGEDHMEVAHHIHIAKNKLADLIVSVKPFTCLSSSGVSDGVQAKISDLYPAVEFIAVETNGDGAANFYSRIQMALQKVVSAKRKKFVHHAHS